MSQVYHPGPTVMSPKVEASFADKQLRVEDVQEAYIEQKDCLVNALDSTKGILGDLRAFNKEDWVVRYPHLHDQEVPEATPSARRTSLRRSLTFADDPSTQTPVVLHPQRQGLHRSVTLATIKDAEEEEDKPTEEQGKEEEEEGLLPKSDFHVLRLDLKLGSSGSSTSAASLVSHLEKSSISNLLDERIGSSISHIEKLRNRVEDTSSKVLVTGDLNAGKSTFTNALLRREIMPVDQQPCTTAFCEVHDAAENDGKEEVHVIKEGIKYDVLDETTFTRHDVGKLESIVADNEDSATMLKIYLADTRAPSESLLNNGVVDISLIDAPGLNRDSIKTTAVFARQEEIDVVVFVVSAENHFTLSAKEFLWNASNEKAYIFIVVNKFDQIKNKEKCRRLVLEQIKQFSPRTYEDSQDLVHFVDSAAALQPFAAAPAFDDLEASLRSFVLVKRSKSKLQPVSTYLLHLLSDIDLLAGANAIVADSEVKQARSKLDEAKPVLDKMKAGRDQLMDDILSTEEEAVAVTSTKTKSVLRSALDLIGEGKLGVSKSSIQMPSYPGILGLFDYARDVKKVLLSSLDAAVKMSEDEARVITSTGVQKVKQLGDQHLPPDVERTRRVFMPEAMFSASRTSKSGRTKHSRRSSSYGGNAVVAGGVHGLGIGLAQRPEMLETTFLDIFDAQYHFTVHFGDAKTQSTSDDESKLTALSVVSVGAGALTMVGGQAVGARGLIEGALRLSDLISNPTMRKWAGPVIGAVTLGTVAYIILELPNTIPRNIGRRIKSSMTAKATEDNEEVTFVDAQADRVSRETRKVLRLASLDMKERLSTDLYHRAKD
jgi:mitofusin